MRGGTQRPPARRRHHPAAPGGRGRRVFPPPAVRGRLSAPRPASAAGLGRCRALAPLWGLPADGWLPGGRQSGCRDGGEGGELILLGPRLPSGGPGPRRLEDDGGRAGEGVAVSLEASTGHRFLRQN